MGGISRRRAAADAPLGLFDRLAMAFAGALFSALTLLGYQLAVLLVSGRGLALGWLLFSRVGLAFVVLGALLGACSRPQTLAAYFGFLWGDHPAWNQRSARVVAMLALVAVLLLSLAWLGQPRPH